VEIKKINRMQRKEKKSLRFLIEKNFRVNKIKGDYKKFKKRQKEKKGVI